MSRPSILMLPSVGSISRRTVRPTVDLPQPDSPTRPSVSPRRIEKLTPSTAIHGAAGALQQAVADREMLLEVAHLEHGRTANRYGAAPQPLRSPNSSRGAPARRPMAAAAFPRKRDRRLRQRSSAWAQRGANTQPSGRLVKRRHHAGNFLQPCRMRPPPRRASDRAAGSRPSARAYRDAAAGRTAPRPAPPRPCARHTSR